MADSNITKKALASALKELMETVPFSKISIGDICEKCDMNRKSFYYHFKDKYDLRDKLIVHKSNEIFQRAEEETKSREMADLEEHIIAMIDNILNQFVEDTTLLNFIAKNLSWGIFTNAVAGATEENNFYELYHAMFENSPVKYEKPEIMMYIIIEMISSSCYSSILNEEPVGIEELKPYLLRTVRQIMRSHRLD